MASEGFAAAQGLPCTSVAKVYRTKVPRRSWACPAALRGVLKGEGAAATTAPKCTKVLDKPYARKRSYTLLAGGLWPAQSHSNLTYTNAGGISEYLLLGWKKRILM